MESDPITDKVINWIKAFGKSFVRINPSDFQPLVSNIRRSNQDDSIQFEFKGKRFEDKDISAVWFRRHNYTFAHPDLNLILNRAGQAMDTLSQLNIDQVKRNLKNEYETIRNYVFGKLQKSPIVLGHWRENNENKLEVLDIAARVGLNIPASCIVSDLNQLETSCSGLITKSLSYSPNLFIEKTKTPLSSYTSKIPESKKQEKGEPLFWSFIQEEIPKKVEIRVFYLGGKCYSMAIFSQSSKETTTDFRNYDVKKPNRNVPFQLPEAIEQKLQALMKELKLNTGSIDLILNTRGEYIFLEVNPVGQFGMVSGPCNYYLGKKVAAFLAGMN